MHQAPLRKLHTQNRPRNSNEKYSSDMSPFLAPEDLTLRSLNKKPSKSRIADVHYYNSLKGKFSMLDKIIAVKLRAF